MEKVNKKLETNKNMEHTAINSVRSKALEVTKITPYVEMMSARLSAWDPSMSTKQFLQGFFF
jgi:hypothetical protein